MPTSNEFIDVAHLNKNAYTFTLPKKVRDVLNIHDISVVLGFFEEPTGEISFGTSGTNVLGTSKFSPTYQITLPITIRKKIYIEMGDPIFFYYTSDNRIILKLQRDWVGFLKISIIMWQWDIYKEIYKIAVNLFI